MNFYLLLAVSAINFAAAFLQASTGFGYAILAMSLMPLLFPMRFCSAISAVTVVVIGAQMVWMLRKSLNVRTVLLPVVCCILTTNIGMYILMHSPERLLRLILSIFILLLDLYFVLMRKYQFQLKKTTLNGILFGSLTGISTGMFNIVGPFYMIYYINICEDNLQYKASLEFSFLVAGIYSTFLHLICGNIALDVAPYIAASAIMAVAAGLLGLRLFRRLNRVIMCRIIYLALPLMALLLIR